MTTVETRHGGPAVARRLARGEPATRRVTRRSMSGAALGDVDLDPQIFGIEPHADVLHQVVTAQLAAARSGTQSTKTRAEVRGGGAKPFRQKGTGRARQGSTRAPQWVGGGVALGPKPRSYAQKTPKKMVKLALRSALSDRAAGDRVAVIDAWTFEVPRTKDAVAALEALELHGRVLVVLGDEDGYAERSFGNLPHVQTVVAGELNAYDVLVNDWVVFTDETLPGSITEVEGSSGAPAEVGDDADAADAGTGAAASDSSDDSVDDPATQDVDDEGADDEDAAEEES